MQGCICPHPPLLIPEVGGHPRARVAQTVPPCSGWRRRWASPTRWSSSRRTAEARQRTSCRTSRRLRGDFGRFRRPEAAFSYDNDVPFAELLLALAGDYAKLELAPDDSDVLDWGVMVPLSFIEPQTSCRCRSSILRRAPQLGQLVRRCAEELGRDTLFVASGDLSHALTHEAPAPYDPRGKLFDDEVVQLMGSRRLRRRSPASTRSCSRAPPSAACAASSRSAAFSATTPSSSLRCSATRGRSAWATWSRASGRVRRGGGRGGGA